MKHYCPICKIVPILRREVRTCGTASCVEAWRDLTPQQKVQAMERDPQSTPFEVIDIEELKKQARGELPYESSGDRLKRLMDEDERQKEINNNPKNFLDKVLGKKEDKE